MTNYERIKQMSIDELSVALMYPGEFDDKFKLTCEHGKKMDCNSCIKKVP